MKQELLEHFVRWKEKHSNEENAENTCPANMADNIQFKSSFIADGCVDYDLYESAETKVLFILKEPACLRKKGEYIGVDAIEGQMDSHWYKRNVIEPEGASNKKYYKKFMAICNELQVNPKSTAMMNLNKRGGYSSGTDMRILSAYVREYHDEIIGQIRILNPDIIISCVYKGDIIDCLFGNENINWGNISYTRGRSINLFKKQWELNGKKVSIYSLPHPAVRMSSMKYQELFLKVYSIKDKSVEEISV